MSFVAMPPDQRNSAGGRGNVNSNSDFAFFDFRGRVDCYYQTGNSARFSGRITRGGGAPNDQFFLIGVQDNSEPGTAPPPDKVRIRVDDQLQNCQNPSGNFPINIPITAGNIQVHPAPVNG